MDTRHSSSLPRYAPAVHHFLTHVHHVHQSDRYLLPLSTMSTKYSPWEKAHFCIPFYRWTRWTFPIITLKYGGQGGQRLNNHISRASDTCQRPPVHHVHQYSGSYTPSCFLDYYIQSKPDEIATILFPCVLLPNHV